MALELVVGDHQENRGLEADVLERLHDALPVDAGPLAAPLQEHAGDRGVIAQADDGVLGGSDEVGAQMMDVAEVPEDALERVVQGPRALDAGVYDEHREHVFVPHGFLRGDRPAGLSGHPFAA